MNYANCYSRLISKRINTAPDDCEYCETHHILPKCLGGKNTRDNLVVLTGREHWIAHLLLHKIHRNSKTAHACHMMAMKCEERGIPYVRNSRMYESIRAACARYSSISNKSLIGKRNGSYGTMWICNVSSRENRKICKVDPVPEGWMRGRNRWKPKFDTKVCARDGCGNSFAVHHALRRYCSVRCSRLGKVASESAICNMQKSQKARFANRPHHTKGRKRHGLRGKFIAGLA